MTQQQRRHYTRKTLNPLPHIHLPSGNGGIVLDVSEQGLRFRAIAPMQQSGPIPFSFTSHSNLIAGIGELVWTDREKKTGGLRFTELPYSALEHIRKWPENSDLRPSIGKDLTFHISAPDESPSSSMKVRGTRAAFASSVASALDRLLPGSFGSKERESWLPALGNALAKVRTLAPEVYFPNVNRRLFRAACALSLGIVISSLVYVDHRETGELLIRLGMRLTGGVSSLMPPSTVSAQSARTDDNPVSEPKVRGPVAQLVPPPASAVIGSTSKEISAGTAAPQAEEAGPRLSKPETRGRQLVVQVAALKEEADARELTDKLRQENFEAFVGTLPVDSFYRVMLGPYTDQASARVVLGRLKKAGFNSFIRRESGAERLGS